MRAHRVNNAFIRRAGAGSDQLAPLALPSVMAGLDPIGANVKDSMWIYFVQVSGVDNRDEPGHDG